MNASQVLLTTAAVNQAHSKSSISDRLVHNWRKNASMAILAVTISALAAALIAQLAWWISVSLSMAVVSSAFSWKMTEEVKKLNRLADQTRALEKANAHLSESERRLNHSLEEIQTEQMAMAHKINLIRQENDRLRMMNEETIQTNQVLQKTNQALQKSEKTLKEQNQNLNRETQSLQRGITQLKIHVQELVFRSHQIAKDIGSMNEGVNHMHEIERNFSDNAQNLNGAIDELEKLIEIESELSEKNAHFMKAILQELQNSSTKLSRTKSLLGHQLTRIEQEQTRELAQSPRPAELRELSKQTEVLHAIQAELDRSRAAVAAHTDMEREFEETVQTLETAMKELERVKQENIELSAALDLKLSQLEPQRSSTTL